MNNISTNDLWINHISAIQAISKNGKVIFKNLKGSGLTIEILGPKGGACGFLMLDSGEKKRIFDWIKLQDDK